MGSRISPRLPPVMKDNLFSLDDGLRRGRPPPSSKNLCEGPLIDEEPAAEATPIIDPTSISRCCIEGGLFPAVPVFFQYPCGITGGWLEWVEHELGDPIKRETLRKAASTAVHGLLVLFNAVRARQQKKGYGSKMKVTAAEAWFARVRQQNGGLLEYGSKMDGCFWVWNG
ncbi:uncharacterized protein Pyn_07877 [Prunus yedoensis var. nudiflora]|uniref:Uncharacterized protein n=1 Tax=Prunus yedoensis var. nudiflora TaxID=2094558 RepID=A0A314XML7_PRUYE|nr:uncharacterized protein Pyn_07877 [Prunus yedoensis var. nudiflora]